MGQSVRPWSKYHRNGFVVLRHAQRAPGSRLSSYGLGLIVLHVLHLEQYRGTAFFAAMGLACFVNLAQNRTFHCAITGPFFLLVAVALALQSYGKWHVSKAILWPAVLLVVGIAFLLERRFAR